MFARQRRESGQAFPIYVVMVAGLLFLVFAFFAVGKAAALRNGAQGAADAAALAAAQKAREQLEAPFLASLPGNMLDSFLQGYAFPTAMPCVEAQRLAAANQADVYRGHCDASYGGDRDQITVEVETRKPVDSTVIPGTKTKFAKAEATAVVEFRCSWKAVDYNDDGVQDMYFFTCEDGGMVEIAPSSPPPWSQVSKILFDVHLIDD
ncbi:pilus assembly protein TadG-related protein [Streptomyces sp. NBC_00873]|uniref:pilus assembly protein TadG-related protein n=1 Tax=Streptomyces sp. NBC_00873 TaxID=2975852 RepID=UPI00386B3C49|nr:pilus assembly protein TadG-related protein [Streptomyces sp. NBC_00873]